MWRVPVYPQYGTIPTIEVFLNDEQKAEVVRCSLMGAGMSKEDYDAIIQHYREVENSGPETINYVPRMQLLR